jgi:dihydrofolate synthase / folylpolyglutamate synthase
LSDWAATLRRLYALESRGRKLGLERMQAACAHFGHPERAFEVVHVAGTNGKGTVSAFVASMARASGKRVGLYTSPPLVRFVERIQVDGAPIDEAVVGPLLDRVLDEAPELTFFEVVTLAAFLAFREAGVELVVLEVGLGGRLDATNVVPAPRLAAITRIAFDHREDLGDTLAQIGAEKAGIIKPGSRVVLGKLHPEARLAAEARAAEVGATIVPLGSPEPKPGISLAYPRIAMVGTNLAVAVTLARELGLDVEAMSRGIEATQWPGRNELLHRNREDLTLLDCAHNADAAVALTHVLETGLVPELDSRRDVALVLGTKNWRAMMQRLQGVTRHRLYVKPPVKKGLEPELIAAEFPGEVFASVQDALTRARELATHRGLVVVTGSCFLVGAARAALLGLEQDPPIDL